MKKFFYLLICTMLLTTLGCMQMPLKAKKTSSIPEGFKQVKIEKIKVDLLVPVNWNMAEKFDNWDNFIFTDVENVNNPEVIRNLNPYDLTNRQVEYKNAGFVLIQGHPSMFNKKDIELHQVMYPKVLQDETSKENGLVLRKLLLSNDYQNLQILSIENPKNARFLRLEFLSDSKDWGKNKKIIDVITGSLKVEPNF